MKIGILLLACAASLTGWTLDASAQTAISFSFGGNTASVAMQPTDLAGAPGVRVGNWNNVGNMSTTGNLATYNGGNPIIQSNGSSTGLLTSTITTGNTNFGGNFAINGTAQTNDAQLYNGVFDQYDGTATTINITNIPYASYSVYFYMHSDSATRGGSFTIGSTTYYMRGGLADPTNTGSGYALSTATVNNGATTTQGNYVVFTGLSGNLNASFTAFNAGDGTQRNKVVGFEIVNTSAVPEPGSVALMVCGATGLLLCVRRARRAKA